MNIVFILRDGTEQAVDFVAGESIWQVAQKNGKIPLKGACEGMGICGACHVIIETLGDKLPAISDSENDALDSVAGVTMKSRLACQVVLNEELDGLRIKLR